MEDTSAERPLQRPLNTVRPTTLSASAQYQHCGNGSKNVKFSPFLDGHDNHIIYESPIVLFCFILFKLINIDNNSHIRCPQSTL